MSWQVSTCAIASLLEDGLFIGHIAGIRDIVGFHGESVAALRQAFKEAVDDYLDTCEKINKAPQ